MSSALQRIGAALLSGRRALGFITAVYLLAGFVLLHYDYALNNEGLIIHYTGIAARSEFRAAFFAQKAKPVLAVLYALPSLGGVYWTMVAHLVVSALALPLIAAFARDLGYRLPNLAALVLGFSPVFFLGGAAGIANNDAVVGTVLVLFLLGRRHSLASGLVLGCLPWVRAEMAPLVAMLGLHAIAVEPNRRFAIGAALFPVLYGLAGAHYHGDLLWMVHYPPASPANPDNPMWQGVLIGPAYLFGVLGAVTPIAGLVICAPFGRLTRLERTLFFYMAVMIVLLEVMPIFKIGNFAGSPRYQLQVLPILALLAARVAETWWQEERPRAGALAATLAGTIWSVTRIPGLAHAVPIIIAVGLIVALAWLRRGHAAVVATALLAVAGPALVPGTQIARSDVAAYLEPMGEWFREHPNALREPIYTNSQLLDAFMQLRGKRGVDVRFLIGFDHLEGLTSLTNPHNGQRESALRVAQESIYGGGVIASKLRPDDLPPGTLFALRVEPRLDITLPPEIWSDRFEILMERENARIARLRGPTNPH